MKKNTCYPCIILVVLCILFPACRKNTSTGIFHAFDPFTIEKKHPASCSIILSPEFYHKVVLFTPQHQGDSILLLDTATIDWEKARYLVAEVYHENDYSAIVYFNFYGQDTKKIQLYAKIGVLPRIKTKVIFNLSYLDGQTIYQERLYRQLKGFVYGKRITPAEISKITLSLAPYQYPAYCPSIQISSIYITSSLPDRYEAPATSYVDEFGQMAYKSWEGKIQNKEELVRQLSRLEQDAKKFIRPATIGRYGGYKDIQFKASGFFRCENDGKHWWLVDPEGYAFLSIGINCVRPGSPGPIYGQEELFTWLPDEHDSLYADAFSKKNNKTEVNFFISNLVKVYGKDWRNKWDTIVTGMLNQWGFNTIANWSDSKLIKKARMPYVLPLSKFPTTTIKLFRDFPDVFNPAYKDSARMYAQQLQAYTHDTFLIGYFLANEPHWAFGNHNLAHEMLKTTQPSYTKNELIKWLREKYNGDINALNQTWKTTYKKFENIKNTEMKALPSINADVDLQLFSKKMVNTYIHIVCDEVKKVDANHLNLGLRYAWISSDLCYEAGKYFDIFSINGYNYPGPPPTEEITARTGKPVLIGEFHFGSTDRGLPANGIFGAKNQEDRGLAYRYYVENGVARPEIVGIHYFQLNDQIITGRFDGENYNIGFFDICMQPYTDLTEAAKETHKYIYEVAINKKKAFDKIIDKVPQIFY